MQFEFAALEQGRHLIPGLVHAPSVDALNRQAFENDVFGKIERDGFRGQAKQRNSSAAAHNVESRPNRVRMSGHFQHHIHAQPACLFFDNRPHIFFRGVEHIVSLHLLRQLAPGLIHFQRKHASRAYRPSHRNREQPNRAASGHRHGLCRDLSGKHGVDRVSQRIQNRGVFFRNGWIQFPDIRLRDHDIFGKRAVGVHPNDFHVLADMLLAGAAQHTLSAGHVHLGGNEVAFLHAGHFVAERHHFSAELMPRNQGWLDAPLRPPVPLVNVQVSATNGSDLHLHQHVFPAIRRDLDFADFRAGRSFRFHHRQHCRSHAPPMNSGSNTKRMILASRLWLVRLRRRRFVVLRFPSRDAQRLPFARPQMLGQKDDLPDVHRVMSNLTIDGL